MLHPAYRSHCRFLGSHHPQPPRSRRHVLVLLPIRPRGTHLVERMDHQITNRSIRHRSRYAIIFSAFTNPQSSNPQTNHFTGFVYFASYTYFSSTYFPHLPTCGKCAGEEFAAFAGMGILSSYLLLFISFYLATYKKSSGAKGGRKRSMSEMGKKAAIDMSKLEVPTVEDAMHVGGVGKGENGEVKENGSANGSITARATRTKRA